MSTKKVNAKTAKKRQRTPRPKQEEMHLTGIGVENTTDKKLIELGENLVDENDTKKAAAKRMKELGVEILNRMNILGLKTYRVENWMFRDDDKHTVKVTKVKEPAAPAEEVKLGAPVDTTEGVA